MRTTQTPELINLSNEGNLSAANNLNNAADVIELAPFFRSIWRAKWWIGSFVILILIITALVLSSIRPTYRATTTLLIDNNAPKVVSIEQIYGLDGSGTSYLQTQFNLLKSRPVIERAVKQLNLINHPDFDPNQQVASGFSQALADAKLSVVMLVPGLVDPAVLMDKPPLTDDERIEIVVNNLINAITVEPIKGSNLVQISVEAYDKELVAKLANAIAKAYIESQLDASAEMTNMATGWMNSRLEELRVTLKDSEDNLKAYMESQGLIDLKGVTSISASELEGLNMRLMDARRATLEVESEYQQIQRSRSQGWEALASTPAVMRNPLVQTFRSEEAKARSKVDELSQRYGPGHPTMLAAKSELDAASSSLRMQVEQVVAGIERNYQIARANEGALRKSYEDKKSNIKDIGRAEFKLRELQREVETNKSLFDTFMTRLKETTATSDLQTVNARIADPAVKPINPVKPKKSLILFLTGLLAFLFATGVISLRHSLNNTFKRIDDVENILGVPVFGLLPIVKKVKARKEIVERFKLNTDRPFIESVKTIRTAVTLTSLHTAHPMLMITSSLPGEGKTTTATNMALAFGQLERTLLIEADMRRPTLAKTLEIPIGTPGLANLLAGTNTVDEAVVEIDGLHVITAGLVPPNPLELISSAKFEQLLTELSERFDRIIIDSPPINAVSDGLVLAQYADAVMFVIKSDSTPQQQVKTAVGKLLQHNAPLKGVVLNQVDVDKARKEGGAYAGYYDYYGYSQTASA